MKKLTILAAAAMMLSTVSGAFAAGGAVHPVQRDWPHTGPFGTFDRAAVQRGFQVYQQVCAGCHSLRLLAFRNLQEIGFSEDQVKTIASGWNTQIPTTDNDGEPTERAPLPSDKIPGPYANEKAARAANGGALPPDLSLIIKARADGANYVYSLLAHGYEDVASEDILNEAFAIENTNRRHAYEDAMGAYEESLNRYEDKLAAYQAAIADGRQAKEPKQPVAPEEPEEVTSVEDLGISESQNFNAFFTGWGIAMAQPLYGEDVEYTDGTEATLEQHASDVVQFLTWAAEPRMEDRKRIGIKVLIFLLVLTVLLYFVKRKVWSDVH
jgi:cytochrome c1